MSTENQAEIAKLQKLIRQFQGIAQTSRSPQAISNAKKEIHELSVRLEQIAPGASKDLLKPTATPKQRSSILSSLSSRILETDILSRYQLVTVDKSCTSQEVAFISMVLDAWEKDFSTAVRENYIKLYYSHASERDSHFHYYNAIARSLDALIKSCQDYANTSNEELKQQFIEIKERSIRQFLFESINYFNKIKDFWQALNEDIKQGGNTCLNKEDVIIFEEEDMNQNSFLEEKTVSEAIAITALFFKEVISTLNLPNFKK